MTTVKRVAAVSFAVVLGVAMLLLYSATASAYDGPHRGGGDDIEVTNFNGAAVINIVGVSAESGEADAEGGDGGDASAKQGRAMGGDGGPGGTAVSGAATAWGYVGNTVNSNRTVIDDDCGCEPQSRHSRDGGSDGDIEVKNMNLALVMNMAGVSAESGEADAEGGDGGDARARAMHRFQSCAAGGDGAPGGTARSGAAYADGMLVNVVNSNVTRVDRSGPEMPPRPTRP